MKMIKVANWLLEKTRKLRKTESILSVVHSLFFFNLQTDMHMKHFFIDELISAHQGLHRMEYSKLPSRGYTALDFQLERYH